MGKSITSVEVERIFGAVITSNFLVSGDYVILLTVTKLKVKG